MISGIYIHCDLTNGKKYIGQSINIKRRLKNHLADSKNNKVNNYFHSALNKHGIENFYIIKIEYPKEQLNEMEKYYIEFFNTMSPNGYNLQSGGNSNWEVSIDTRKKMSASRKGKHHSDVSKKQMADIQLGEQNNFYGKSHSEETKKNISEKLKGRIFSELSLKRMSIVQSGENHPMWHKHHSSETKIKISNSNKNKIISEETKKKMSIAQSGKKNPMFGRNHSEETKKKISESCKRRNIRI